MSRGFSPVLFLLPRKALRAPNAIFDAIFCARLMQYCRKIDAHFAPYLALWSIGGALYIIGASKQRGVVPLTDVVLVAVIGAIGSGLCSLLGVVASSKLTQYRLEQLEKKVQAHNNLVERMYKLEKHVGLLEQHVDDLHNE